ncbi:MAG: DUF2071 domain-containing protein [Roseivirga sp.]|nr:DUF2071 domain-containing protein [Roseivirga sp.]
MSFLKAEWRKLALVNYSIDPDILKPYLPYGTELDLWNDHAYVSLVGFMFLNTRMLGMKIPFHINFEEVNLRFYVKRKEAGEWKRGVVFIKEIVPKPALTFVANTVYGENYETMPMKHVWLEKESALEVSYQWKKSSKWHSFSVNASTECKDIAAGSETEFITEHYWGYAQVNGSRSNEYEVTHPRWQAYEVRSFDVDVDFGAVYGEAFDFLSKEKPLSVMLAEGSEITVESKRVISSR